MGNKSIFGNTFDCPMSLILEYIRTKGYNAISRINDTKKSNTLLENIFNLLLILYSISIRDKLSISPLIFDKINSLLDGTILNLTFLSLKVHINLNISLDSIVSPEKTTSFIFLIIIVSFKSSKSNLLTSFS